MGCIFTFTTVHKRLFAISNHSWIERPLKSIGVFLIPLNSSRPIIQTCSVFPFLAHRLSNSLRDDEEVVTPLHFVLSPLNSGNPPMYLTLSKATVIYCRSVGFQKYILLKQITHCAAAFTSYIMSKTMCSAVVFTLLQSAANSQVIEHIHFICFVHLWCHLFLVAMKRQDKACGREGGFCKSMSLLTLYIDK